MLDEAGRWGCARAIALVEDDEEMRSVLHDFLSAAGYEVHAYASAAHFLAVFGLSAPSFALVISDMHMPGPGGVELLRETRRMRPELPVILMTALPSASDEQSVRALGANVYLHKPFPLKDLLSQIQWSLLAPAVAAGRGA